MKSSTSATIVVVGNGEESERVSSLFELMRTTFPGNVIREAEVVTFPHERFAYKILNEREHIHTIILTDLTEHSHEFVASVRDPYHKKKFSGGPPTSVVVLTDFSPTLGGTLLSRCGPVFLRSRPLCSEILNLMPDVYRPVCRCIPVGQTHLARATA
jgi:hypothetical protein